MLMVIFFLLESNYIFNAGQETIKLGGFPSQLLVYAPKDKQAKEALL